MANVAPEHPEIAADLREAQTAKGYSNARLARLAGVSRKHIDEVLKGSNISVRILKRIMAALQMEHVNLGEMAAGSGEQRGVSPEVLLALAEEMEQAVRQSIGPALEMIETLRSYARGHGTPELNAKAREVIRKAASDPTNKALAKRAEKRKQ